MSDDPTTGGTTPIPTPADVHHEHPTVLVPVPPDEDVVRRIETHDDEVEADADATLVSDGTVDADEPVVEDDPVDAVPVVDEEPEAPLEPVDAEPAAPRVAVAHPFTAEESLAQVVADAASTVPGVHALGSPTSRAVDGARTRLLGTSGVPGVSIDDTDADSLSVDVSLVAEYPANVTAVADAVREDVAEAIGARHSGPVGIDVTVTDVHGPFDDVEPISEAHPFDSTEEFDDITDATEADAAEADAASGADVVDTEPDSPSAAERLAQATAAIAAVANGTVPDGTVPDRTASTSTVPTSTAPQSTVSSHTASDGSVPSDAEATDDTLDDVSATDVPASTDEDPGDGGRPSS